MAKSRLGRGLGALFPSLPGEPQQPAAPVVPPAQPATPEASTAPRAKSAKSPAKSTTRPTTAPADTAADRPSTDRLSTAGRPTTAPAATHRGPTAAPREPEPSTEEFEGPISPLESTIPSMGTMTRNGDTVAALSAPMTLQPEAAEHKAPSKSTAKRATMPTVDDMAHPSDMFFDGTPLPGAAADGEGAPELKPVEGGYLVELDLAQIGPNLHQPRTVFRDEELHELAESIKEVGVLQPIVVRKRPLEQIRAAQANPTEKHGEFEDRMDSTYELVMGERRWRASQLAGLTSIPAIVKTTADDYMLRDALLENLHRVALNPLEEAAAYQQMIDEFGLTQMQLAQSVSKSRPQIANTLRLMNLPASVQREVVAGKISAGHARALLGLPNDEAMEKLAQRIIDEGLSVRSVEEIVSMQAAGQPKKPKTNKHNPWAGSPIQASLEERFATKVSIKGSEKHGRIEIVFSSPEDMDRILSLLGAPQEAQEAQEAD